MCAHDTHRVSESASLNSIQSNRLSFTVSVIVHLSLSDIVLYALPLVCTENIDRLTLTVARNSFLTEPSLVHTEMRSAYR